MWYSQDLAIVADAIEKAHNIITRIVDQQGEHLSTKGENVRALLDVAANMVADYDAEWETHDQEQR